MSMYIVYVSSLNRIQILNLFKSNSSSAILKCKGLAYVLVKHGSHYKFQVCFIFFVNQFRHILIGKAAVA